MVPVDLCNPSVAVSAGNSKLYLPAQENNRI